MKLTLSPGLPSWLQAPLHRARLALRKHLPYPRPFERFALPALDRNLIGAEIGVLRGDHAASLLRHSRTIILHLVDPYLPYRDFTAQQLAHAQTTAVRRFTGKVLWHFCPSLEAVHEITEPLDYVYLDGAHDRRSVQDDSEAWWPKIRPGGILGGHDIFNGQCPDHDGLVQAVIHFAACRQLTLKIEAPDWWIFKPL